MKRPPKCPIGALTRPQARGVTIFYSVNKSTGDIHNQSRALNYHGWFDNINFKNGTHNRSGYVFDNYFHALAYSLKVKANLKEKDNA